MRKVIILSVVAILLYTNSFSTEPDSPKKKEVFETKYRRTIFDRGYVAVPIGYSNIDKEGAFLYGFRSVWLVSNSLGLGIGVNGFVDFSHYDNTLQRHVLLTAEDGGLYVEPILFPKLPVHFSFPLLLGFGDIMTQKWDNDRFQYLINDVFLIAEPAAEIDLNISTHFKIALGASYKFATLHNIYLSGTSPLNPDALKTWSYKLTFKFGGF